MTGAKLLHGWRMELGLTQMALSQRLRVSQSALCEWEKGKGKPSLAMALLLDRESEGKVPASCWNAKKKSRLRPAA